MHPLPQLEKSSLYIPDPSIKSLLQGLRLRLAVAMLGSLVLLVFRLMMLHGQSPIFNPLEMPATFSESAQTRILTLNYLVTFNAGLLLWPWRLSMDWSHGSIPLVESLTDYRVPLTLLLYTAVGIMMWRALRPMFTTWAASFSCGQEVGKRASVDVLDLEGSRRGMGRA